MNTIAIIAAHPDDEILGCGATMQHHINAQDNVYVLIVSQGITSRNTTLSEEVNTDIENLKDCAKKANAILGVHDVTFLDYPDNQCDTVPRLSITQSIEKFILEKNISVIYTHYAHDLNVDHRRVCEAVITATRPYPNQPVKKVLFFEVPSSTEWMLNGSSPTFTPNYFIDISQQIDLKLEALSAYYSEMRDWPHARSLKGVLALAQWRGASIGVDSAEAFQLGRCIIN